MSRPPAGDDLDLLLLAARPRDPSGKAAERAAVRVLARVASLECGASAGAPARGARRARARASAAGALAAAILVGGLAAVLDGRPDAPPRRDTAHPLVARVAFGSLIDAALRGDRRAAAAVREAGPAGRAACLDRVLLRGPDAAAALDLFVRAGGPVGVEEADRLERAFEARDEADGLSRGVLAALARSAGDSGAETLASILVHIPDTHTDCGVEADVVAALRVVAERGRPGLALGALRRGAERGHALAAAAAVRIGGSQEVDRLLATAPRSVVASAAVAEAVRDATDTARALVVRLAVRGDPAALALAAAARLEELPPALANRLADPRRAVAVAVAEVEAVAAVGGPAAWRALPPALESADPTVAEAVRVAVRAFPAAAASALADAALARPGSAAAPYYAALAEMGDAGLDALAVLVRRPASFASSVEALAASRGTRASATLAALATRTGAGAGVRGDVLAALSRRLAGGDDAAGTALLALARAGPARPALDALAGAGDAGARALAKALADPRLRRVALLAIDRATQRGDAPALLALRGGRGGTFRPPTS